MRSNRVERYICGWFLIVAEWTLAALPWAAAAVMVLLLLWILTNVEDTDDD